MSKLHKALQRLRENRDGPDVSRAGTVEAESAADESRAAARSPLIRSRSPLTQAARDEQLPDRLYHVDRDALVEVGLLPDAEHADRLAQEFRRIKRPIINSAFGIGIPDVLHANLIMLASALPKSGKTYCSINLAVSIARERDVGAVLVDADVLKPNISRVLGLESEVGLIDHLLDPSISLNDIIVPTDFHGIVVIPAGRQHAEATELLASRRMASFVAGLSERFSSRAVIVDTPPLLLTNEAQVLAEHMGQIVMVIEAGASTQDSVLEALDTLNRSKPINAILNKSRVGVFGDYGAGAYGYYSAARPDYPDEEEK